ncbi:MAG: cation-transporting P-type ATPase [Methanobacteriota archaeon]
MKPWHSMEVGDILSGLDVRMEGLSSEEARRRLQETGPNELKREKRKSPALLFIGQFKNILIVILLIAIGLSLALGEVYDAIVIMIIVVASAALGFTQEYRAEKALEALKKMTAPTALVVRDGNEV